MTSYRFDGRNLTEAGVAPSEVVPVRGDIACLDRQIRRLASQRRIVRWFLKLFRTHGSFSPPRPLFRGSGRRYSATREVPGGAGCPVLESRAISHGKFAVIPRLASLPCCYSAAGMSAFARCPQLRVEVAGWPLFRGRVGCVGFRYSAEADGLEGTGRYSAVCAEARLFRRCLAVPGASGSFRAIEKSSLEQHVVHGP